MRQVVIVTVLALAAGGLGWWWSARSTGQRQDPSSPVAPVAEVAVAAKPADEPAPPPPLPAQMRLHQEITGRFLHQTITLRAKGGAEALTVPALPETGRWSWTWGEQRQGVPGEVRLSGTYALAGDGAARTVTLNLPAAEAMPATEVKAGFTGGRLQVAGAEALVLAQRLQITEAARHLLLVAADLPRGEVRHGATCPFGGESLLVHLIDARQALLVAEASATAGKTIRRYPAEGGALGEVAVRLDETGKLIEVARAIGAPANDAGDYTVAGLRLGW